MDDRSIKDAVAMKLITAEEYASRRYNLTQLLCPFENTARSDDSQIHTYYTSYSYATGNTNETIFANTVMTQVVSRQCRHPYLAMDIPGLWAGIFKLTVVGPADAFLLTSTHANAYIWLLLDAVSASTPQLLPSSLTLLATTCKLTCVIANTAGRDW